jgi:tyramine---L-glutamate ligase
LLVRIFIYEFFTGGGLWHSPAEAAAASLVAAGRAMASAVVADFAALPDVEVSTTRDSRVPAFQPAGCQVTEVIGAEGEVATLCMLASQADWTLLIAPETGGALLQRCGLVELAGGRLLSPSPAFVKVASDKQATMELLASRRFPVPRGIAISSAVANIPPDLSFPSVLKPIDGCGSQGVRLVHNRAEVPPLLGPARMRLEEFVPGLAVSVAILCGAKEAYALPVCEQRLSTDGRFTYLGGRLRLPPNLDGRARRLALAAVKALPSATGYIGVDLVLGDAPDGSGDRVIEINPRLTTSYVGLRAAAQTNLAAAMLAIAAGQPADLRFGAGPVEFTADGVIT